MNVRSRKLLIIAVTLALGGLFAAGIALSFGQRSPRQVEAGVPIPNAVARVITASGDLIGGDMSRGRLGDYYLANGEVQVVIQQPQRNLLSVGQFGGQIIDADLVRAIADPERDSFEEWAFGVNLENTCHYTKVNVINAGSSSVKFGLFDFETLRPEATGMLDWAGSARRATRKRWASPSEATSSRALSRSPPCSSWSDTLRTTRSRGSSATGTGRSTWLRPST